MLNRGLLFVSMKKTEKREIDKKSIKRNQDVIQVDKYQAYKYLAV